MRRSLPLLLLELSCLLKLLSRDDSLVLGADLLAIVWDLVAFLGLRPEIGHRESVVQIGPKVIHDADWEHDIGAKLSVQSILSAKN